MLRRLTIKHYLLVSFSAALFALLGEAVCAVCSGTSLRGGDVNTSAALLMAPAPHARAR